MLFKPQGSRQLQERLHRCLVSSPMMANRQRGHAVHDESRSLEEHIVGFRCANIATAPINSSPGCSPSSTRRSCA